MNILFYEEFLTRLFAGEFVITGNFLGATETVSEALGGAADAPADNSPFSGPVNPASEGIIITHGLFLHLDNIGVDFSFWRIMQNQSPKPGFTQILGSNINAPIWHQLDAVIPEGVPWSAQIRNMSGTGAPFPDAQTIRVIAQFRGLYYRRLGR